MRIRNAFALASALSVLGGVRASAGIPLGDEGQAPIPSQQQQPLRYDGTPFKIASGPAYSEEAAKAALQETVGKLDANSYLILAKYINVGPGGWYGYTISYLAPASGQVPHLLGEPYRIATDPVFSEQGANAAMAETVRKLEAKGFVVMIKNSTMGPGSWHGYTITYIANP